MSNFITKDFQPGSSAIWKQKIQFELDGADYNQNLLTKTNEGITIKPFYHSDTFEKLIVPTSIDYFKFCKTIAITFEEKAAKMALEAINKGITSLKFLAEKPFNIETLFNNLLNKDIEFHFQLEFLKEDFINELALKLKDEIVFFNIDIIGKLARTGNWHSSLNSDFKIVENLLQKNNLNFILSVNTAIYQNSGANTVQQVAYAIAHANEYLTKFGSEITDKIQFNFATGSNFFFEISKIRAFRYLYNLMLNEYNTNAIAQVFTEPSLLNKTISGTNKNSLKTSTEIMSAILGGANTVSIGLNDSVDETLQNESINNNLKNSHNIVTDSYYIETITKQIAEKALTIFKDIEKGGGFLHQLKEGTIQRKIKESAEKEHLVSIRTKQKRAQKTLIIPITPKRLKDEA